MAIHRVLAQRLGLALLGLVLVTSACTSLAPTPPAGASPKTTSTAAKVIKPLPVNGDFDYQIGGAYPPAAPVKIIDRDRNDKPVTGRYTICYVNAFQTQPDERSFWTKKHPTLLLRHKGRFLVDPGWPDEYLFDVSTATKRKAIAKIVNGWIDSCAKTGFQAIEPDNLDSYTRSKGHLTSADNQAMARRLVKHSHAAGLAIAQKNTSQWGKTGRAIGFDFAIAESCEYYRECGSYTRLYGARVIEIEYTDDGRAAFNRACKSRGAKISILYRDRDVTPRGDRAYRNTTC